MLKIEVIKFEAQDIITNSGTPAAPDGADCVCNSGTSWDHGTDERSNYNNVDHTRGDTPCYADKHPGCHPIM